MIFSKLFSALKLHKVTSVGTFVNISTVMTGTITSAIVPVVFSPLLSRIFRPADYGVIGLYVSIATLLGVLVYSHYSHAVMLVPDEGEAKQVIWFSIILCGLLAIVIFICLALIFYFSTFISSSSVGRWYFFIPLSVFMNGVSSTLVVWGNRVQRYKTLSYNRILQALFTVLTQIILGLMIKGEAGLVIGLIIGQLVSVLLFLERFCGHKKDNNIGYPEVNKFKTIAVKYKNFALFSTPSDFINSLINQTPFFFLQKFAGISAVGNYAFTQRFLGIPQMFISSAVTDVFKQRAAFAYNQDGSCRGIFVKTFKMLSLIGLAPFFTLIIFGPVIISFVFGEQWKEAGVFCQYLGILYYLRFVISPLSYVYFIAGRLKENFLLHILFLLGTALAFYLGHYFFDKPSMLILCYSIIYSMIYIIYLIRSYKFSER